MVCSRSAVLLSHEKKEGVPSAATWIDGVAFQAPPGSQASSRGEAKDSALLSSRGDLTSLAPHERLPEILVVPREKTPTGAAARGNP